MKDWHIKEAWIDCLTLLSNQMSFVASWLIFDLHSGCRVALVLQFLFCFSCYAVTVICYFKLPHSKKKTHNYNTVKERFAKMTLWFKRCFLFSRAEVDFSVQWFVNVSQLQAWWEWQRHPLIVMLSFSFYGLLFPYQSTLPKQKTVHLILACLKCTIHNSLNFCKSFVPLLFSRLL